LDASRIRRGVWYHLLFPFDQHKHLGAENWDRGGGCVFIRNDFYFGLLLAFVRDRARANQNVSVAFCPTPGVQK